MSQLTEALQAHREGRSIVGDEKVIKMLQQDILARIGSIENACRSARSVVEDEEDPIQLRKLYDEFNEIDNNMPRL
jgi:hypothetical protein